jgi:hypothetical protein
MNDDIYLALRYKAEAKTLRAVLAELVRSVETAVRTGDWKVDGANDPDAVLGRARKALSGT